MFQFPTDAAPVSLETIPTICFYRCLIIAQQMSVLPLYLFARIVLTFICLLALLSDNVHPLCSYVNSSRINNSMFFLLFVIAQQMAGLHLSLFAPIALTFICWLASFPSNIPNPSALIVTICCRTKCSIYLCFFHCTTDERFAPQFCRSDCSTFHLLNSTFASRWC